MVYEIFAPLALCLPTLHARTLMEFIHSFPETSFLLTASREGESSKVVSNLMKAVIYQDDARSSTHYRRGTHVCRDVTQADKQTRTSESHFKR